MAALQRSSTGEPNALLKDLYEKKQNLRRIASEVGSMASELRDVRGRMAAQDTTLAQETARRQSAEAKIRSMESELVLLQKSLDERNSQAVHSASVAEQYLQELVDIRTQSGTTQGAAHACSASGNVAELQCATLLIEIEKKNDALQDHENRVTKLEQQCVELHQDLIQGEISQKHLRDEVERMQIEMKVEVGKALTNKDSEFKKLLEDFSVKNTAQLGKHLTAKDEEIARVREEVKLASVQLKLKTQELEVQLERQRRADQELKKRVIKLEFWLQDARSQTRKLQRIAEKKGKEIEDLRARLWMKETDFAAPKDKPKFWDGSRFKILLSVSMVILVFLAKH